MRCLVHSGFALDEDGEYPRITKRPLAYAHFDIEVGEDGFPVELGAGAMAVTYRARDTILQSVVALKVIDQHRAGNAAVRARFLREARAAARLHHPNVARVTYYGEQDGECFYVMEFVEGETFEEHVRRNGPVSVAVALEMIAQATRALAAAEACGVVHRDIKPSNLMIASRQGESRDGDSLVVKMIDFGVAKVVEAGIDQTQADFIGTPAFASPEQFIQREIPTTEPSVTQAPISVVDTRSDIYSLGITLWYLLSGQTPFTGRSLQEIRAKQSQELPMHQLRAANIPAAVTGLLKSMLAVNSDQRPQSARELLAAILRCHKGELAEPAVIEAAARQQQGFWIAALPFKFSGDPEVAVLGDGLNEEVVTGLIRFPYLRVLGRSDISRFVAEPTNVHRIGNQLGARFVLEGSLRQAGNKLRIGARLVDTDSGAHLWANTFDREWRKDDTFTLQDEITDRIVAPVADVYGVLARTIASTTGSKMPESLTPYEAVWRFFLAQQRSTEEDHLAARSVLEQAVKVQPDYADAWAALAIVYVDEHRHGFNRRPDPLERAQAAAERAMDANAASQMANFGFAVTQYFRKDLVAFRAKAERALVVNPRCSYTLACLGRLICYSGEWERGIQLSRRAIELSPHHPGWYYLGMVLNEYRLGRYAEALSILQTNIKPDYWVMHYLTSISHAQLGNLPAARAELERTIRAWPLFAHEFGRAHLEKWFQNQPELVDDLLKGVRLAGFRPCDD
ncbi:MAG: protein kinase [Candidatus Methylacidiphilales bacterium]